MNILKATALFAKETSTMARCFLPKAMLLAIAFAPLAKSATDTPPNRMTVQSYITDDTGTPIGSAGTVNKKMTFFIYSADTGGDPKFADVQIVSIDDGHFSVVLGEGDEVSGQSHDLSVAFSGEDASDRFLEIQVADTDGSNAQTLSPRLRLLPSAYSFLASYANEAAKVTGGGVDAAAIADGVITSAKIASESLTAANLGPNSVGSSEVIDNSLTQADLAPGSVGTSELATNAMLNGYSGVNQLYNNVDFALKSAKAGNYSIYAMNELSSVQFWVNSAGQIWSRGGLSSNMVNSATVTDNTLTSADLAPNSVGSSEVTDNSLTASDLAANSVGNSELGGDLTLTGRNGVNVRWSDTTFGIRANSSDNYLIFMEAASGANMFWVNKAGVAFHSGGAVVLSDRRYKTDIKTIDSLLDAALALRPVNFRLTDIPGATQEIGLIAQEVEEVLPDLILNIGGEENRLALAYDRIGVVAIGAVQELNAKVESLEAENTDLEERLAALEALVSSLVQ